MNDRYLFRAKDINNGEWRIGFFREVKTLRGQSVYFIGIPGKLCTDHETDIKTIGQCTGLMDKNGKLIFEGDILKGHATKCSGNILLAVWHDNSFLLATGLPDNENTLFYFMGSKTHEKFEIVGNVHDNPELLEGAGA